MGNLKNFLFVAVFMLFGLGVQANTIQYTPSVYDMSFDAPQGAGVIHIVQGRHTIHIEIVTEGPVELSLLNGSGEVVFQKSVQAQKRVVNIQTKDYTPGAYTLVAASLEKAEEIGITLTE